MSSDSNRERRMTVRRLGLGSIWLLLCGTPLWAAPITAQQAETAVAAWRQADLQPLGAAIGQQVETVQAYAGTDGETAYYIVYMNPSGFVIVSADDAVEPIIGFAATGTYDPSDSNPLGALVTRDVPERIRRARNLGQHGDDANAAPTDLTTARRKWASLLATDSLEPVEGDSGIPSVSDERVSPLILTRWSQTTAGGGPCYNLYTPNNYPCGCVATALAQVLKFHQHPTAGVGGPCFTIGICGAPQSRCLMGGDASGGPYKWNLMPAIPGSSMTSDERDAIGRLCHDAGVAVNMNYCSGGSGADTSATANALRNSFGYNNAVRAWNNGSELGAALDPMINPNLDAGWPVILGITGDGGHAIVTDGYGYESSTLYHHLNLGWAGSYDAWYDLPAILSFTTVYKCVYNIYITGSGEMISGRVTDTAGNPLSGAIVTAQRTGGAAYTDTSNANGIYALAKVPSASSYTVSVTLAGYQASPRTTATGVSGDYSPTTGNVWGVDFSCSPENGYCPASSSQCDEFISGVQVGTINNTGTTCSWYADYTALNTTMQIGTDYPITVTNGEDVYPDDQCGIWVDWNQDEDFDDDDERITVSGSPGFGPYTGTITPPATAGLGATRMRVRILWTGSVAPCGVASYGEVEDYTIIVEPTAPPTATASNDGPACEGQDVHLFGGPANMIAYAWTGPNGFTSDEQDPTVSPAVAGEYCLSVTNAAGTSDPVCTTVEVIPQPDPPTPLNAGRCGPGTVDLSVRGSTGMYRWWDAYTGGTQLGSGSEFTTPTITATTTYYVDAVTGSEQPLDIGDYDRTYASTTTRGFHFTAPVDFAITGLRIPTDVGTEVQNVQVVRFSSYPSSGTPFTTLYYAKGIAGINIITVNIPVSAGDEIGILGARGTTTMRNCYGPNTGYTSSIADVPVTLQRIYYQANLYTNQAASGSISREASNQIAQVEMYYTIGGGDGCASDRVPAIATINDPPVSAPSSSGINCAIGGVQFTGGPAEMATYAWTGPNGYTSNEQNPLVPGAEPGEYCLMVVDGNGCSSAWVCTLVTDETSIRPDLDEDCDVDSSDFTKFQVCFNGPNRPPVLTRCFESDFDGDGDVDLADFAVFAACFNGPNRLPQCP